jgi:plastocyanin
MRAVLAAVAVALSGLAMRAPAGVPPLAHYAARTVTVHIANFAFVPADTTVAPGDTVVWVNDDEFEHVVAADSAAWKSPTLGRGRRFVFVAASVGRVPYHCAAHPVMHGALTIAE